MEQDNKPIDDMSEEELNKLKVWLLKENVRVQNEMKELTEFREKLLKERGVAAICDGNDLPCGLAMPRRQEIFACMNRYRKLLVK